MDTSKLKDRNKNPWYILMTLHGEQEGDEIDFELAERNRKLWNAWVCGGKNSRIPAHVNKFLDLNQEEFRLSPDRKQQIQLLFRNAWADRNQSRRDVPGVPDPIDPINLREVHFKRPLSWASFALSHAEVSGCKFDKVVDVDFAFVADALSFRKSNFGQNTTFRSTNFVTDVDFEHVRFEAEVLFEDTRFQGHVSFHGAKMEGGTDFERSAVSGRARFTEVDFCEKASFGHVSFGGMADFENAQFRETVDFRGVTFHDYADFGNVCFLSSVDIAKSKFAQAATFQSSRFGGRADFAGASFGNSTYFSDAKFSSDAMFSHVEFGPETNFTQVLFKRRAFFRGSIWEICIFQRCLFRRR